MRFSCATVRRLDDRVLGIVRTPAGRVYACTWSIDTELTEERVLTDWTTARSAFRPFDEVGMRYVGQAR